MSKKTTKKAAPAASLPSDLLTRALLALKLLASEVNLPSLELRRRRAGEKEPALVSGVLADLEAALAPPAEAQEPSEETDVEGV